MAPEDERKSIWAAVGLNSDRITALEAIVKDRDESMREMIREAVRDVLLNVAASDLTFTGGYLAPYLIANTKTMALKVVTSGAAVAAVPMDTTGTLNISGCYLIET